MFSYISVLCFSIGFLFFSCTSNKKYKRNLLSDKPYKINNACFHLGESKDTSAIKLLLTKALDPRMTTHIQFKGMTVNYCRLAALRKISGVGSGRNSDQFGIDTASTLFYLDWAIKHGYIKDSNDVSISYY